MRSIVLYCPHLERDLTQIRTLVPEVYELIGLPTPRGEDGCLEMHKKAVRYAKKDNLDRLFVMEDDCRFTEHFDLARWDADAQWAQENGYDVLAGGCTRTYDERMVREGILEVSAFHSAHCVVYFKSGYDKVQKAVQPYDWSLGRDCGMRCALTIPFVAVQGPSYSGILRQNVNYVPLYELHEQALRRSVK